VVGYAFESGFRVLGLLEPYDRSRVGTTIHGCPVTWLEETPPGESGLVIVGTGEPARRPVVARLLAAGWSPATLVHPRAHVGGGGSMGIGVLVAPGVVVGACARIGDHVVLGRGSLIGHHARVGAFSTVAPGGNVAGHVELGEDVHVGMGAVLRDHIRIGAGARIAMGAVVTRDVEPGADVRGLPARVHGAVEVPAQRVDDERQDPHGEAGRGPKAPAGEEPRGRADPSPP
jgi:sugar O-acyltransferase (sialic acid O-acetyltransferase NeuD family)